MPLGPVRILLPLLSAAACSPSQFVWGETGSSDLASYLESFATAAGTRLEEGLSLPDALRRIRSERVLWLGDDHRDPALHELQLELLSALARQGVSMVLLLEAIGTQDEPAVADWLRSATTLDELLARTTARWADSWLEHDSVDAEHYRAVLAFAKEHCVPVLGLEPTPRRPLRTRDDAIAARVRNAAAAHPGSLLVVQIGQAHLLGDGALIARTRLGGFAIGGSPTPALRAATPPPRGEPAALWRSDGGLWWFARSW